MAQALDALWLPVLPSFRGFGDALIKGAGSEADKSGTAVGKRFGAAIAVGVAGTVAAVGTAGAALYKVGEVFDDVTDTIRAGTGKSGKALDGLVASAKTIGTRVPADFSKIGAVVADVSTRMGLSGETMETVASQYLEAGRVLGEDIDVAKTSAAFNAFKIEGEDVVGAMDHLFQVAQTTGVGMNELAAAAARNAPAMQTLGFSFEETTAMVGSFDKAGLNSGAIMASMSKGLVTLAKDGEQPAEAFKRVQGEIGAFIDKGDKASALNLASKVFGTKGATQFIGALESGTLNLEDMTKAAGQSGDSILGVGEDTADFAEQWAMFKNNILVWLEPMGARVFGTLGTLMGEVTDGVKAFGAAWEYNDGEITSSGIPGVMERLGYYARQAFDYINLTAIPALQNMGRWLIDNKNTIGIIAGVIGALLIPVFARLGVQATISGAQQVASWAASGGGAVKTAALYLANSYKIVGAWIAMGAAAIKSGAQTVAIWAMYQWDSIKAIAAMAAARAQIIGHWIAMSAAAVLNGAKTAAVWTAQIIGQAVAGAASFALQAGRVVAGWALMGIQSLVNAARMAAAWLIAMGPVGWIIAAVVALVALVIANWDKIKTVTIAVFGAVAKFASDTWNNIKKWVSDAIDFIVKWVQSKVLWLQAAWAYAWREIRNKATEIWSGIKNAVTGAIDYVVAWVNSKVLWLQAAWAYVWREIRNTVTEIWNEIRDSISNIWKDKIKPVIDGVISFVRDKIPEGFRKAVDAIEDIWNGIRNIARKPVNFVIETVYNSGLKSMFNGIAEKLGLGWRLPDIDPIPAFAKGGQMGRGWKLVGEEGPELINTGPGYVYTASETKKMLAGQSQMPMQALNQANPVQAHAGIGGFWSDAMSSVQKTFGAAKDWAVGQIGSAVSALVGPIKDGLSLALPGGGMNELIRGAGHKLIDSMSSWAVKNDGDPATGGSYSGPLGAFFRPAGGFITSGFGASRGRYPHAGIDFAVPIGSAVRAMFDGIVQKTAWNAVAGRSGKGLLMGHGDGMSSYYGHLSDWIAKPGQKVKAGDVIARSGNTGNSTGPHLHAELWKNGNPFNFAPYLHDSGGVLNPGLSMILNNSRKPEAILNSQQWADVHKLALSGGNGVTYAPTYQYMGEDPESLARRDRARLMDTLRINGIS